MSAPAGQSAHGRSKGIPKSGGRAPGAHNILTRKALLDLANEGGVPPHIMLLRIGRDKRNPLALRVSALGFAAPYFAHKMAPPAVRIVRPIDLQELKDAQSAADAAAHVITKANAGEIDLEAAKFLLDSLERFSAMYERQRLEERVMQLEEQLRSSATRSTIEGTTTLTVIEGGRDDEPSTEAS
jgi:hypothetical protein